MYLLLICSFVILSVSITWKYILEIIVVDGSSMYPTLKDGDLVLINKLTKKDKFIKDDILVYTPPGDDKLVIKRLRHMDASESELELWLEGDNSQNSLDSRYYGYVNANKVEGRVIKTWKRKK